MLFKVELQERVIKCLKNYMSFYHCVRAIIYISLKKAQYTKIIKINTKLNYTQMTHFVSSFRSENLQISYLHIGFGVTRKMLIGEGRSGTKQRKKTYHYNIKQP